MKKVNRIALSGDIFPKFCTLLLNVRGCKCKHSGMKADIFNLRGYLALASWAHYSLAGSCVMVLPLPAL